MSEIVSGLCWLLAIVIMWYSPDDRVSLLGLFDTYDFQRFLTLESNFEWNVYNNFKEAFQKLTNLASSLKAESFLHCLLLYWSSKTRDRRFICIVYEWNQYNIIWNNRCFCIGLRGLCCILWYCWILAKVFCKCASYINCY